MSSSASTSANSLETDISKGLQTIETKTEVQCISLSILQRELHEARRRESKMVQEIDRLEERCSELDDAARGVSEEAQEARRQSASRAIESQFLRGELEEVKRKLTEAEQRAARYRAEKFRAEREVQDIHWEQSKKDHSSDSRMERLREKISNLECAYQSAFAMNKENEELCTCLQLRLKAMSEQMLILQKENIRVRQSLSSRITELMRQSEEDEEEEDSVDDERSVHELVRDNELLRSRVRYLASLLTSDGHADLGENHIERTIYDRIVSELRTLEVVKADQDTEISRLTAEMARLRDDINAFGLDIGDEGNFRMNDEAETKSRESRKSKGGKRGSKSRRRRRSVLADCVPQ